MGEAGRAPRGARSAAARLACYPASRSADPRRWFCRARSPRARLRSPDRTAFGAGDPARRSGAPSQCLRHGDGGVRRDHGLSLRKQRRLLGIPESGWLGESECGGRQSAANRFASINSLICGKMQGKSESEPRKVARGLETRRRRADTALKFPTPPNREFRSLRTGRFRPRAGAIARMQGLDRGPVFSVCSSLSAAIGAFERIRGIDRSSRRPNRDLHVGGRGVDARPVPGARSHPFLFPAARSSTNHP